MNTPEEHSEEEKNKKTVYKETTTDEDDELSSGETSSSSEKGTSAFSRTPERKNKPLGSGHEPGVTPGRDF
jgi:hypothetical protein